MTEQDVLNLGFEGGSEMPGGYDEFYIDNPEFDTGLYIWRNSAGEYFVHIDEAYGEPPIIIKDAKHLQLLVDFVFYK